jgi:hypothetical protein
MSVGAIGMLVGARSLLAMFLPIHVGVPTPFLLEPYTVSPTIFFGTLAVAAPIGAFAPVLRGQEIVGQSVGWVELSETHHFPIVTGRLRSSPPSR